MPRYIDADKLLDDMSREARDVAASDITDADEMLEAMEMAMRECVHNAPTVLNASVDSAFVSNGHENVGCGDCRHYKPDLINDGVGFCDINGGAVHDEHFCSHFERCDGGADNG